MKKNLTELFRNFQLQVENVAKKVCYPNFDPLSEDGKDRICHINYINFFTLPIILTVQLFSYFLSTGVYKELYLKLLGLEAIMFLCFLLTCRDYPVVYKVINCAIMIASGPLALHISQKFIFLSISFLLIIPMMILLLYQNFILSFGSFFIEFLFFNFLLYPSYKSRVLSLASNPENLNLFLDEQSTMINFILILNSLIAIVLFFLMRNDSAGLLKAKKKTERELQVTEKFLLKFTHELRNPVNSLLGNLEIAHVETLDHGLKTLLNNAKVCGELLLQLINNILDSGKIELGVLEVNFRPTNVYEVFEKIWSIANEMIKKKSLYGHMIIDKNVPTTLELDSYRVIQIMLNMIRNAVRFTEKGNVKIHISWLDQADISDKAFEPTPYDPENEGVFEKDESIPSLATPFIENNNPQFVRLNSSHQKISSDSRNTRPSTSSGILKIIVSDTGVGMSPELASKVFTKFPEVQTIDQNKTITGLSMFITKRLVEKMNGQIRVYSELNKGTTFIVCLKTQTPASEPVSLDPLDPIQEPADQKLRAMIVDDNPYNSELNKKYFEKNRVDVVGLAKNGTEALEIYKRQHLERKPIHIITMDLDMPFFDAKLACERIREYETEKNLTPCSIVIISGNCFEQEIKECLDPTGKIRANHFISKPIYYNDFQRLIAHISANYAEEPQLQSFHPQKILIVDDDLFNRQILEKFLAKDKYQCLEAKNGQEAVEVYMKNWKDIALILMDCEMPIMNGYDAATAIRKLQREKRLPTINIFGLTGNVGSEFAARCREAGMDSTITKPVKMDELITLIRPIVEQYEEI